VFYPR